MSESLNNLADINKIDFLIRSMDVGFRSTNSKSDDLSCRIFALKFFKERNRSTFTEGTNRLSTEVLLRSLLETILEPSFKSLLLPSTACMASLKCNFSIVRNILCEFLSHDFSCLVSIKNWAKPHGASASSLGSANVTSNSNRWKTICSSN